MASEGAVPAAAASSALRALFLPDVAADAAGGRAAAAGEVAAAATGAASGPSAAGATTAAAVPAEPSPSPRGAALLNLKAPGFLHGQRAHTNETRHQQDRRRPHPHRVRRLTHARLCRHNGGPVLRVRGSNFRAAPTAGIITDDGNLACVLAHEQHGRTFK